MPPVFNTREAGEIVRISRSNQGRGFSDRPPRKPKGSRRGQWVESTVEDDIEDAEWREVPNRRKRRRTPRRPGRASWWSRFGKTQFGKDIKGFGGSGLTYGISRATGGSGWGAAAAGRYMGGGISGNAAAILLTLIWNKWIERPSNAARGAFAQLQAAEGLMPSPTFMQNLGTMTNMNMIDPNNTSSARYAALQRNYIKTKDAVSGSFSWLGAFIDNYWEGQGHSRAMSEASQEFWRKQTYKAPEVIEAHKIMGLRQKKQFETRGYGFGSFKETGPFGG